MPPHYVGAVGCGHGQGKQKWTRLGGPVSFAESDDLSNGVNPAILRRGDAPFDGCCVLQGQLPLVGVVAAVLGAQGEEPPEPGHVIHGVGVAAGVSYGFKVIKNYGLELTHRKAMASSTELLWRCLGRIAER